MDCTEPYSSAQQLRGVERACAFKPATGGGEVEEGCRLAWGSLTGALQERSLRPHPQDPGLSRPDCRLDNRFSELCTQA